LVSDLESQLLATQKQEDELEALIKNCDSLIENAKNKTEIVASQIETNKFKAQVASVLKDNSGDAVSALQRLEADAERHKAEAEAAEEFAGENQSLEQKYAVKPTVSEADVSKYLKSA
jgi:phage shock protein A